MRNISFILVVAFGLCSCGGKKKEDTMIPTVDGPKPLGEVIYTGSGMALKADGASIEVDVGVVEAKVFTEAILSEDSKLETVVEKQSRNRADVLMSMMQSSPFGSFSTRSM